MYKISPHVELPAAFPSLAGKTALVTGGSRGIGRATAELFISLGCSTLTLARHGADISCDVSNELRVRNAFQFARQELGALDFVVNCAGYILPSTIPMSTLKDWQRHLAVNLTGAFLVSREAMLSMSPAGTIVNIASSAARKGKAGWGAYAASKVALISLTETIAAEADVRAFCVSPGRTNTQMRNALYPDEDRDTLLSPREVANLIAFCCSDQAAFATGQTFWISR